MLFSFYLKAFYYVDNENKKQVKLSLFYQIQARLRSRDCNNLNKANVKHK